MHRTKAANQTTLTDHERETYSWQIPVAGFGESGQRTLKAASILVSRCGGLGGVVAYELAAAGVGQLVLAHGGNLKRSDLNRQLLMTHDWIGKPRMESIVRRLHELNPSLAITAEPSNLNDSNAERLVAACDVIVDCAPLFEERYLLNRESVRQGKPMVEAAVYDTEMHLTTFVPGQTPCLHCLYPEKSETWTRRFPVFGAVSGTAGSLAGMEAIKVVAGMGQPLTGRLLTIDLRDMTSRTFNIRRSPNCPVCGHL